MAFEMRTTKPSAGNKYYIRKTSGGYSNAIKGSPVDSECDVLANCVGYAYGRFNEIGGYGSCKYLAPVNAENFIQYKGSCEVGQTPKPGACMVWRKGATLSGSDGAGHVAIVEKVVSATEVITSESGYGSSKPFWNSTRKKGSGNWGAGSVYTFLGFIYNPAVKEETPPATPTTEATFKKGDLVKLSSDAKYYNGKAVPSWVRAQNWYIKEDSVGDRAVIDKNEKGNNSICSPVNTKYLTLVKGKQEDFVAYDVRVDISDLNIRTGAGTNFGRTGKFTGKGVFTIVAESAGSGSVKGWGKLKSGAGWISLDYCTKIESASGFEEGDKVKCKPGVTKYSNGGVMPSWVRTATLYVRDIEQDGKVLLVSTEPTKKVYTGRVNASDMQRV